MNERPTVFSICGDPGGAEAIAPVIKVLRTENRLEILNYTYNQGKDVLARHGMRSSLLPNLVNSAWALRRLHEDRPSLLLSGTSCNGLDWEKLFISSARSLGISSLAVLDFWSNYGVRFSDHQGNLVYLPDTIAVMDERARREMINAGISDENILVSGQPAFDSLAECRRQFSLTKKLEIRQSLRVKNSDFFVLFASQPIKKLYGSNKNGPCSLGFDEESVLLNLIGSLETVRQKYNKRITLLIRPHPREAAASYSHYQSREIDVVVSTEGESRDYAMASDLVIGMNTVLLVEACYLGCLVLSLQPGLRQPDPLPTNAWGASLGVYRVEEIGPALERLLLNDSTRHDSLSKVASLKIKENATRRITDYIYSKTLDLSASKKITRTNVSDC